MSKVTKLTDLVTKPQESVIEQAPKTHQIQLVPEELQKHNIFFATPCYGGMLTDQFFLSMFKLTQALNHFKINYRLTTLRNESLVTRARNILTAMFLESDCTHLMFIDADIEFEPDSVLRMLAMNKPLIAAAYPKKTVDWESVKKAALEGKDDISKYSAQYAINLKFKDPRTKEINVDGGAIEVMDASTGFFMVQRVVFEKMIQAYPELHYKNDSSIDPKFNPHCYALFDTWLDPDDNRYLSEDYTFCRRWQKIGGKIWLDPNTRLSHVGAFTFPGDVSRIFGTR
jgi:glycosyltransferase involved in cell wall biosynthesis